MRGMLTTGKLSDSNRFIIPGNILKCLTYAYLLVSFHIRLRPLVPSHTRFNPAISQVFALAGGTNRPLRARWPDPTSTKLPQAEW